MALVGRITQARPADIIPNCREVKSPTRGFALEIGHQWYRAIVVSTVSMQFANVRGIQKKLNQFESWQKSW